MEVDNTLRFLANFKDPGLSDYVASQTSLFYQVTDTALESTNLRQALADIAVSIRNVGGAFDYLKHSTLLPNVPEAIIPRLALPDWLIQVADRYLGANTSALELRTALSPLGLKSTETDLATALLSRSHTRAYLAVYRDKTDNLCAYVEDSMLVEKNPLVFYGYSNFPQLFIHPVDGKEKYLLIPQTHKLFTTGRRLARVNDRHFELGSEDLKKSTLGLDDFEGDPFVQALMGGEEPALIYLDHFLAPRMEALELNDLDFRLPEEISKLEIPKNHVVLLPLQLTETHVDLAYLDEPAHYRLLVSQRALDEVSTFKERVQATTGGISPEARAKARAKRKKKKK